MLTDARRHALFRRGIGHAMGVLKKKKQGGQEEILVMDVGTGTGLLSLEAARAATDGGQAVRVVACEGFPAVAAVAEKVVAAAGMGGT
jgi:predicted RNA methylase